MKYQKYTLLTSSGYYILNERLSKARGRKIGLPTERTLEMNPQLAKVNIQYDEDDIEMSYELRCVAVITGDFQKNHPEIIEPLVLIDRNDVVFTDERPTKIEVEDCKTTGIDWLLNHCDKVNISDIDLIIAEIEPRSENSDMAVDSLVGKDVIIITVAP